MATTIYLLNGKKISVEESYGDIRRKLVDQYAAFALTDDRGQVSINRDAVAYFGDPQPDPANPAQ